MKTSARTIATRLSALRFVQCLAFGACALSAFAADVTNGMAPQATVSPALSPAQTAIDPEHVLPMSAQELSNQVLGAVKQAGLRAADAGVVQRVEVEIGGIDGRLRLAPCDLAQAYLPSGTRAWGRIKMGLRCVKGVSHWNVFVPVTVHVWSTGLVLAADLPSGAAIEAGDLRLAEVDLAGDASAPLLTPAQAVGRQLVRPVKAGASLRAAHLRPRRFFAAGDPVKLVVRGTGFQVSGNAQAIMPGDEGQCVRIRTEAGRVLCGRPSEGRQVEVTL